MHARHQSDDRNIRAWTMVYLKISKDLLRFFRNVFCSVCVSVVFLNISNTGFTLKYFLSKPGLPVLDRTIARRFDGNLRQYGC